jgi:carbon monoxide dehydrogenase subunit G
MSLGLWVATAPAAFADDGIKVQVAEEGHGVFVVRGSFTVPAGSTTVWTVLTDYDKLGSYVPSVKSSVVKHVSSDTMLVAQESSARFMAISKTMRVLLQLQVAPQSRIFFTDVGLQDFEHFTGSWTLERTAMGTRVDYVASAKPRIYLPIWGGSVMHGVVKDQLTSLKREILRRPATADDSSAPQKPAV